MDDAPHTPTPSGQDSGGRPPGPQPLRTPRVDASLTAPGELRVWLDDDFVDRAAPPGWVHVETAGEAIALLDTGRDVALSLDHDLGDDALRGLDIHVVDWLAEQQIVAGRALWPREGIALHTANPQGRDAMARAIRRYASKAFDVDETSAGGRPRFTFRDRA